MDELAKGTRETELKSLNLEPTMVGTRFPADETGGGMEAARLRFLQINDDTGKPLRQLWPNLAAELLLMLDSFYDHLPADAPGTRAWEYPSGIDRNLK